jgi:hypothetical protein
MAVYVVKVNNSLYLTLKPNSSYDFTLQNIILTSKKDDGLMFKSFGHALMLSKMYEANEENVLARVEKF